MLLSSYEVYSQRTQQRIDVGDEFFRQEQYEEALEVYEKVIKRDKSDETLKEVAFKIGDCYRMMLNYDKAREWYSISLNLGYEDPIIYLLLSEMALGLEDFNGSIEYVGKYLEHKPDDDRGQKILTSAEFSLKNYGRGTLFEASLEEDLTSNWQEWGVSFMENVGVFLDDPEERQRRFDITVDVRYNNVLFWALVRQELKERIVFASTRAVTEDDEGGYSNIYQATYSKLDSKWDKPILLGGEINSEFYDAFLSFDKKNRVGYFMNCGGIDGTRESCDLYYAEYDINRDVFNNVKIFEFNNDDFSVGYPSINDDGTVLYFASDMDEGYGGYDIYKVIKDTVAGTWSEPINLGDTINTRYNDAYPYIAGNVLYFSSFGHPGFGGFDVFYSEIDEDGKFSEPQNIGAPINSSADDFGFVIDEDYTRGFFSSNRPGGSGTDDLYSFRITVQQFALHGQVTNEMTRQPVSNIDIYIIGDDNSLFTVNTDADGNYKQDGLSSDVVYNVEIAPENYMPYSHVVSVKEQLIENRFEVISEYELDISLEPFEEEETEQIVENVEEEVVEEVVEEEIKKPEIDLSDYDLPLIYFDFSRFDLKEEAKKKLDTVYNYMKNNSEVGLVVHAHTDEISGYLFNFYLSQKRAHSIIEYLVSQGIDESRLYPIGHGKMQLFVENASNDKEHRLNRRAHFEAVSMSGFPEYWAEASRNSFRYLNSLDKEAHYAEGVEFMVQFIAVRNPIPPKYYQKIMDAMPRANIIYYYDEDKFHRYLVGSFKEFQTAYNVQRKLRELGYDIYLVAFKDGKRISVSKARRLVENN